MHKNIDCRGDADGSEAVKIPERLLRRLDARKEDVERRREAKESQSVTEETSDFFSSTFNGERAAIEALLSACSAGGDRASVSQKLEEATTKTEQLQKFLNDSVNTGFLMHHDLGQAQGSLKKLQTSLAEKRAEVLPPKKKFTFSSSRNAGKPRETAPVPDMRPPALPVDSAIKVHGIVNPDQCGFSNVDSQTLTKSGEEIHKRDVLLTHLTNCKVRLFGAPSTLHIKDVSDCEILCGPVSSSVFVDRCTNCTLAFACQQLRTHNTTDTQVYLHVHTRPIIEHCQGVRFAPFSWTYPGLDNDFGVSGLDRGQNNWTQVDDFNWLAATPSPNWSVISEADRKASWDA